MLWAMNLHVGGEEGEGLDVLILVRTRVSRRLRGRR